MQNADKNELSRILKQAGYELGFDLVSISSALPLEKDFERYDAWRKKGFAGDLNYMVRDHPRRWVPQDLLPEARSVVTFAANFFSGEPRLPARRGFGRVARYAWGKDYHVVIKARLEEWVERVSRAVGRRIAAKVMVDSGPLLERAFAGQSGIGFVGKNTLIISRQIGSFIFLSEVLTDLEPAFDPLRDPSLSESGSKDACGGCRECLADCPTGALVAPRQLDARKCISYWTIENRGGIPEDLRPQIGDWIFGCDICQDVCPYNGLQKQTLWPEFLPEQGAGPYLDLNEILSLETDEGFRKRFAGSPVLRAKRSGLLRNACVVAANQGYAAAAARLKILAAADPEEIVRDAAGWAWKQLQK